MLGKSIFAVAGMALSLATQAFAKAPVVVGYWAAWEDQSQVDLSKYTHVNVAFAYPRVDGALDFVDKVDLPAAAAQIHASKAKVLLSVGGWTNSGNFSDVLKDSCARSTLLSGMTNIVKENDLDGIDIDWEYPGRIGDTCNSVDEANDTPNFLSFLKDLHAAFATEFGAGKKLITMAVRVQPFDIDGVPTDDVSEFAKYLDFVSIMMYDLSGTWLATTAPHTPLNFAQGKGEQISATTAVQGWIDAGMPANKITLGLAFYGRSVMAAEDMSLDMNNQYVNMSSTTVPMGDQEDEQTFDPCANATSYGGTFQYRNLRKQGILTSPTKAAEPWVRGYDMVTQTPWLFNKETKQYVTYDDVVSLKAKVDFAASKGLLGVMSWIMLFDYENELIDVVHTWGKGPLSNAPCATEGQLVCQGPDGTSPNYLICIHGAWLSLACNPNSACVTNLGSIVCGWPSN